MFSLSLAEGKSTKNISSNLPFLNNSGGNALISFAVATTNTGSFFSCIQVKNVPNTLALVPPSVLPLDWVPLKPFSISSIHKTHGEIVFATSSAYLMFLSDSPTIPPKTLPKSNLSNGNFHSLAIAFAVNDLPQPGTPSNKTPRGVFNPNF